jgi:pyrroline-5-carboxylate reductase
MESPPTLPNMPATNITPTTPTESIGLAAPAALAGSIAGPLRRLCFVGGGNMASALIGGLIRAGSTVQIAGVVETLAEQRAQLSERFHVPTFASIAEAASAQALEVDAIVLAVKPQQLQPVTRELGPYATRCAVISLAAGVRATDIARWLGGHERIIRAMPNTPALVGAGITGLFALPRTPEDDRRLAGQLMSAVGTTLWVNAERLIDAVTAMSGSGPAYVFYWMEAMQTAGIELGLRPEAAHTLTIATFNGATRLAMQSEESPARLRERVTSPGGTTAAALAAMAAADVELGIKAGIHAAYQRGAELGDQLGDQLGDRLGDQPDQD